MKTVHLFLLIMLMLALAAPAAMAGAGLGLAAGAHDGDFGVQFGFNSDTAEFGLNLGGGAKFMLTEATAAFVEPKFVIGDRDGFCIMGGIYF